MNNSFRIAEQAAKTIAERSGIAQHEIALTLGSGWIKAMTADIHWQCEAHEIPGFRAPEVEGFAPTISSIKLTSGKHALVLPRTHLYQGHGVDAVAHPARTAAAAGATIMVLTNGAGGIRKSWQPGTVVLISDHINLTALSPIEGAKFVDLTDMYSKRLRDIAKTVDSSLDEAIYAQFRGPHYESPAEIQMAKIIGAELVGMSTALEAIAAREVGLEVLGLSLMTNHAAGIQDHPLSHAEVLAAGVAAEARISKLLAEIVKKL